MFFHDFPIINSEWELPILLISVGLNKWQYPLVSKEGDYYPKFLYCTKGSGTLILDGEKHIIDPYTAFFIPAGCPHEYYSNGEIWDTHWVVPSGTACRELLEKFGFIKPLIFKLDDIKYLEHTFRKMHEALLSDKMFGNYRASAYLYDFLIEMYRIYTNSDSHIFSNPVLIRAIDYINSNLTSQLTLDDISEAAGVSKQHICRLFRSLLNCRPMEYAAKCRLREAKKIMSSTDKSLEQIAEEVGLCSASYLCKLFKRYEGITPSQFKNS